LGLLPLRLSYYNRYSGILGTVSPAASAVVASAPLMHLILRVSVAVYSHCTGFRDCSTPTCRGSLTVLDEFDTANELLCQRLIFLSAAAAVAERTDRLAGVL